MNNTKPLIILIVFLIICAAIGAGYQGYRSLNPNQNSPTSIPVSGPTSIPTSGSIAAGHIYNVGAGYTLNDQLTVSGGNNDAVLKVDSVNSSGIITGISIINSGSGYQSNFTYNLSGGTGENATYTIDTIIPSQLTATTAPTIDPSKPYVKSQQQGTFNNFIAPTSSPTVVPTSSPTVTPTVPPCSNNPVDIVLALDRSGTMGGKDNNNIINLTGEKNAALSFVNTIESQSTDSRNNIRIGVVAWAGNNYLVTSLPLTNSLTDIATIKNFINNITYITSDNYTCLECAIAKSADLLAGSSNRKYVILMSDGIGNKIINSCINNSQCTDPTPPTCTNDQYLLTHCSKADTIAIAEAAVRKASGVFYHVIGYGRNTAPATMIESNLKTISGDNITSNDPDYGEFYHYAGDNTLNWSQIFASIALQICE